MDINAKMIQMWKLSNKDLKATIIKYAPRSKNKCSRKPQQIIGDIKDKTNGYFRTENTIIKIKNSLNGLKNNMEITEGGVDLKTEQ